MKVIFESDSTSNPIYREKADLKDRARTILKKYLDEIGICMTSKFAKKALKAMMEFKKDPSQVSTQTK